MSLKVEEQVNRVAAEESSIEEFRNEPFTDFSKPENRQAMQEAIEKVRSQLGREYEIVIGGERIRTAEKFNSYNPSRKGEVIGIFQKATPELAARAVEAAYDQFQKWQWVPAPERASILFRTAAILRRRKLEMAAWMVFEVGKNWAEADADVAEAIDFCEFYAREALRLWGPQPISPVPGEANELRYIPLGVGVVIPPWNFPLAILVGMTTASWVSGNTVVLKPSSDSPAIAAQFVSVMEEAGLPAGVVNFLSGPGSVAGNTLVQHPKTRFVAFTGSKEVGLGINEIAAKPQPGQIWIKRVIAEMGGKDSIVVDSEVDLDAAVEGVFVSAFGYQGQKCSACSRAIVAEKVYDEFVEKLKARAGRVTIGPTDDPSIYLGPVINEAAMRSILNYIEIGKKEGRVLTGGKPASADGYFIEPTIIVDVAPKARISQEEIFGPVLAVIKARDFEDALEIANNTEYGLTGAVFSSSRAHLEEARQRFHVGNLYLNRKCTGAMVGGHPFGGFNMSGTDSKAGGRDYLLLFTQAKAIAEKIGAQVK
ncbi:MAG: L-glutamate gamma-semialdehyde dehydrogenase [Acidobacteria bacterium]|nr:L-glutamate gamma-semialdehyde dehydrogenase [Acidobacteriota bacterium]